MKIPLKKPSLAGQLVVAVCLAIGAISDASAGMIAAAVAVSSPQGDYGSPYRLANAITASSGLSQTYVDGVTDFDVLVKTATYNGFGGATHTFTGYPQYYLFDLGSAREIGALGLWAEKIPADGSPTSFSLYAGTTTLAPLLGTFTATGGQPNAPGQEFDFAATTTRDVLFQVLTTDAPLDYSPSIGQAVFESVPEPDSFLLVGIGAIAVAIGAYRRPRTNA